MPSGVKGIAADFASAVTAHEKNANSSGKQLWLVLSLREIRIHDAVVIRGQQLFFRKGLKLFFYLELFSQFFRQFKFSKFKSTKQAKVNGSISKRIIPLALSICGFVVSDSRYVSQESSLILSKQLSPYSAPEFNFTFERTCPFWKSAWFRLDAHAVNDGFDSFNDRDGHFGIGGEAVYQTSRV